MLSIATSILLGLLQLSSAGAVIGVVKVPGAEKAVVQGRVVLVPAKYIESWNKQVQQRLDNYWETFKPEFFANKEHFAEFDRLARAEAMSSVTSQMRRELGADANQFIRQTSPTGHFEFQNIPPGTYQMLVEASANGKEFTSSKPVKVQDGLPTFVDVGKPVS